MPAPSALRSTVRRALRGTTIGLGLLVSVPVVAPPALASPISESDGLLGVDFQMSGTLVAHLAAAGAPTDLDLSGARFDVLDADGAVLAACDTDGFGKCTFAGDIPPGTYRLRQDATRPVPGLVPSTAVGTFTVCAPQDGADCTSVVPEIVDASQFRTGLAVTVRDGATQAPLAGASYSLTGPDYRHIDASVQRDQVTSLPDPTLSGRDGRLAFPRWFLPGDWSLTPEVTPRGYRSSGVLPVTLPAPISDSGDAWSTVVGLAVDVPDVAVIGTGGRPVPPPPPPAPRPSPSPSPMVLRPVVAAPVDAAPPPPTSPPAAAAEPAASTPSAAPSSEPQADASAPPPPAGGPAVAATSPLRVSSATSLLDVGLLGFAALLVVLVVFGVGYMRRRARH